MVCGSVPKMRGRLSRGHQTSNGGIAAFGGMITGLDATLAARRTSPRSVRSSTRPARAATAGT